MQEKSVINTVAVGAVVLVLLLCVAMVVHQVWFPLVAQAELVRIILSALLFIAALAVAGAALAGRASHHAWYIVAGLLVFAVSIFLLGPRLTIEYLFPFSLLLIGRKALSPLTFVVLIPVAVATWWWDNPVADEVWFVVAVLVVAADVRLTARRRQQRDSAPPESR